MKNFKSLICVLLVILVNTNFAKAQSSINNISLPEKNYLFVEPISMNLPRFIEHIEFISSGFNSPEAMMPGTQLEAAVSAVKSDAGEIIAQANSLQFKYAMLMDVAVESIKQDALYRYIDDWYGTRYRMGGTTKKGIDCSAFTGSLLLACYSLRLPRTARAQHAATDPIEKEELEEGDLVFFNTRRGISHVGVYLSNNYFVHSSSSQGVVISSLKDSYYSKRFLRGGRATRE